MWLWAVLLLRVLAVLHAEGAVCCTWPVVMGFGVQGLLSVAWQEAVCCCCCCCVPIAAAHACVVCMSAIAAVLLLLMVRLLRIDSCWLRSV